MKRFAGYLAVLPIAIGLVIFYVAKAHETPYDQAAYERALAPAEARFAACMIGEPPSRQPGPRLRDVSLAARGVADWPQRCAPYAEEYARVQNDSDSHVPGLLREKSPNVATEMVIGMLHGKRMPDFDAVTRDVPRPPEPTLADDPQTLHHVDGFEMVAGEPDLLVQLGREVACHFAEKGGGLEPVARCSFVGDRFADTRKSWLVKGSGTRPLAHDMSTIIPWRGGDPLVSAELATHPSRVGEAVYGIVEGKRPSVVVHENGATRTAVLDRPRSTKVTMMLVADQLVWMENGGVFARSLAGTAPGKPIAVGKAAGQMRISCANKTTLAVLVEVDNAPDVLALRIGDAWGVVGPIGEKERDLYCLDDRVVITSLKVEDGDRVGIARTDCTLAGCTSANVEVTIEDSVESDLIDAVPIGTDVLLAYAGDGVWTRRAPLAELPNATPVPVYRGGSADRRDSPYVQRLWLFPRGASVVMLLDMGGIGAIHLRDGKAEAVRVVYE